MPPVRAPSNDVLTERHEPESGGAAGVYSLSVVEGPDRGMSVRLSGRVYVGQSSACDLRLTDPKVSRRHCALDPHERGPRLTDLGSTNGTFVNRVGVMDAFVAPGDLVQVGDTVLRVEAAGAKTDKPPPPETIRFGGVLGASPEMRRLYPLCERLARADVPVVIEGETGTGKEVLAEALHEAGPRADRPFVVFDCTVAATSLLESELFGHRRGAFTTAVTERKGAFEQAHGGTLLIDEIGELDIALQSKLLRAIERREIKPVGEDTWTKVDVRVIAATRRNLDVEVQEGRFRDDLFFRLAIGRIELPPLRRRPGDVALLARHFWRTLGGDGEIPEELVARLEGYEWPGNVRELHNTIARLFALGDLALLPNARPSSVTEEEPAEGEDAIERVLALDLPLARARQQVMNEFERRYVERVLLRYGGNVEQAALASGISRRYFQMLRARGQ
jgi:DNA-binding NtrC family response regulator